MINKYKRRRFQKTKNLLTGETEADPEMIKVTGVGCSQPGCQTVGAHVCLVRPLCCPQPRFPSEGEGVGSQWDWEDSRCGDCSQRSLTSLLPALGGGSSHQSCLRCGHCQGVVGWIHPHVAGMEQAVSMWLSGSHRLHWAVTPGGLGVGCHPGRHRVVPCMRWGHRGRGALSQGCPSTSQPRSSVPGFGIHKLGSLQAAFSLARWAEVSSVQ